MFNYNDQITAYHVKNVTIGEDIRSKLRKHRKANQDRLMNNIREGISVSRSSFVKQGSYANLTMIQESENNYDIDDGVTLKKEELVGERGAEMTPIQVRDMILDALKSDKFKKQPQRLTNCIRVFYDEGHHVDVPSYRKYDDDAGNEVIEIAGSDWRKSNPAEINSWFESKVSNLKKTRDGRGLQLRRMIRLLKRFCRSRSSWNMPNGLIMTMLAEEKLPNYERDDECFYYLLSNLNTRLQANFRVYNNSDESVPKEELTKSDSDANMRELRDRVEEALGKLAILHEADCKKPDARSAWDWVFKSDGFFKSYDGGGKSNLGVSSASFAAAAPTKPVDPQGGGRYG